MKWLSILGFLILSLSLQSCIDFRFISIKMAQLKSTNDLSPVLPYQDLSKVDTGTIQIIPSEEFYAATNFECYYDHQFDDSVLTTFKCNDLVGIDFSSQTGVLSWQTAMLKDGDYEILVIASDNGNPISKIFKIELLKEQTMLINQPALYQISIPQEYQNLSNYTYTCRFQNASCAGLVISQNNMTGFLDWDVPDNLTEGIYFFELIIQNPYRVVRKVAVEIKYGAPFISEWRIATNGETIYLPVGAILSNRTYKFDFIVDWGDGHQERINSVNPNFSHTYTNSSIGRPNDTYIITIKGIIELFSFHHFSSNDPTNASRDKIIRVNNFGDLNWINLTGAFRLTSEMLEFYGGDLSKAEYIAHFFSESAKLHTVDISQWNIPHVKSLKALFYSTPELSNLELGPFNLQNAESLESTFYNASKLTQLHLNYWDVSKVKNMYATFAGTSLLSDLRIDQWQTGSVENMEFMFWTTPALSQINLNNWDVSQVTSMLRTFQYTGATEIIIDEWNTENVISFEKMFHGSSNITTLDVSKWNVAKAKNLFNMFYGTRSLEHIDLSLWDTSSVENISNVFYLPSGRTQHVNLGNFEMQSVTSSSPIFTGSGTFYLYCSFYNLSSPDNQITNQTCLDPASFPY